MNKELIIWAVYGIVAIGFAIVGSLTADEKTGPGAKDLNGWLIAGLVWPIAVTAIGITMLFKGLRWLLDKFADAADEARAEYLKGGAK